jgi:hypothetical protein
MWRDRPDPDFWELMRSLQASGATIGLHGYQHLCNSDGRSLLPLHRQTEFAGAPRRYQHQWIRAGIKVLRGEGLDPTIWVAPRHGFDRKTLRCLHEEGISLISDGFATRPYKAFGLTWLPQQLWGPEVHEEGLWTICVHPNTASEEFIEGLASFLGQFSSRFTSVERVVAEWPAKDRGLSDVYFSSKMLMRIQLSKLRRLLWPA